VRPYNSFSYFYERNSVLGPFSLRLHWLESWRCLSAIDPAGKALGPAGQPSPPTDFLA
jgi:hypothetical protein